MDSTTDPANTVSSPPVTFMEFTLPMSQLLVRMDKLKAGKYYEAQKIYTDWIAELQKVVESGKLDLNTVMDAEGKIDKEKLLSQEKTQGQQRVTQILEKSESLNDKRLNLIAICFNTTVEKLKSDYYPEDLDMLMDTAVGLNRFMANLKKSVAPTADIEG